jgi:hypothetical protein
MRTVYIFIRKDIPIEDQIVQVAHVSLILGVVCAYNGFSQDTKTCRMILFEVQNVEELHKQYLNLSARGIPVELFYEPANASKKELGYTAMATRPTDKNLKGVFYRGS